MHPCAANKLDAPQTSLNSSDLVSEYLNTAPHVWLIQDQSALFNVPVSTTGLPTIPGAINFSGGGSIRSV